MTSRDILHAKAISTHEASHHIVGQTLGLHPLGCSTHERGGVTRFAATPDLHTHDGCRDWVAMLLAGWLGERRRFGSPPLDAMDDHERATAALLLHPRGLRERIQTEAVNSADAILFRRWDDVLMVSADLYSGRSWGVAA